MKTAALLVLAAAGVAAVVVLTESKASAAAPPPPPVPDAMKSWTVADWDAAQTAFPALANQDVTKAIPPHSFLTAPEMGSTLASLGTQSWNVNVGTVADWVTQQRAAGHRVFMSQQIVTPNGSGWAFILDTQPTGWSEVSS